MVFLGLCGLLLVLFIYKDNKAAIKEHIQNQVDKKSGSTKSKDIEHEIFKQNQVITGINSRLLKVETCLSVEKRLVGSEPIQVMGYKMNDQVFFGHVGGGNYKKFSNEKQYREYITV